MVGKTFLKNETFVAHGHSSGGLGHEGLKLLLQKCIWFDSNDFKIATILVVIGNRLWLAHRQTSNLIGSLNPTKPTRVRI